MSDHVLLIPSFHETRITHPLLALLMSLFLMVFHHRSGGNFLRTSSIAAFLLSGFLDVFIHLLLFASNASQMFFRHLTPPSAHKSHIIRRSPPPSGSPARRP